jgi:type VI secretion system secreted protein Hcp
MTTMKRSWKRLITATVVATSLLAPTTALAAVDMFLKIGNIMGESKDAKHKDEIDVLAWSWGASNDLSKLGKTPTSCIQDLSFTKFIDSASPALIMNGMTGEVAPTAVLVVRKAGATPLEYLTLTMKNVRISSYSTGGSGGEDRLTENVTLHFESMIGQYVKQKPDGSGETPVSWEIGGSNTKACR